LPGWVIINILADKPEIMNINSSQRRDFIKKSLIGFGGFFFLQRCSLETNGWQFLTDKEGKLLEAITGQFIPTDQSPGAREACVVGFIDTQLTRHYSRFQQRYRAGLAAIQKTCYLIYKRDFESLDGETQISFLEKLERNNVPGDYWQNDQPSSFFGLMLAHCMQGFYGDPRHGGNCNHVSYKMIDLRVVQFYNPDISPAL
jgi:gluconate 2-dehydrogenase gamma chain